MQCTNVLFSLSSSYPMMSVSVGREIQMSLPLHVSSITSLSNPFVKHCVKLRESSSYRRTHASVLVIGATPIREILKFHESCEEKSGLDCLLVLEKAEIPEDMDGLAGRIVRVNSAIMKRLSGLKSVESVEAIGVMKAPNTFFNICDQEDEEEQDPKQWFPNAHRLLVLDGIQDPGNLGTLVRSAMAFNWDGVVLLPGCCDPFNEKAIRASRGASFQLPIVSGNRRHLEALRGEFGMKMLAGHPRSHDRAMPVSLLTQELANDLASVPLCLVLGSEGSGLSDQTQRECELVSIPMVGEFESLNVSVAGGIFLYVLQARNSDSVRVLI